MRGHPNPRRANRYTPDRSGTFWEVYDKLVNSTIRGLEEGERAGKGEEGKDDDDDDDEDDDDIPNILGEEMEE